MLINQLVIPDTISNICWDETTQESAQQINADTPQESSQQINADSPAADMLENQVKEKTVASAEALWTPKPKPPKKIRVSKAYN
jgi:hypothetical protein